jgi:hypothetical protein
VKVKAYQRREGDVRRGVDLRQNMYSTYLGIWQLVLNEKLIEMVRGTPGNDILRVETNQRA